MEKKILKFQLYTLFIITTLNLIYFYYRDTLPDNYYEISYQNQSINFLSYYAFSFLANFGYWCGIWVTVSFVTFAALHTFVLNKKKDPKYQIIILALLPFCFGLCFLLIPESVGEGLYYLIKTNVSAISIVLSVLFFGLSFFYLVSEKMFFKTMKFIWRKVQTVTSGIRRIDLSVLKKFKTQSFYSVLRTQVSLWIENYKKAEKVTVPSKFTIPKLAKKAPVIEKSMPGQETEVIEENENSEEIETFSSELEEVQGQEDSEDEFNDSQIDLEEDFEEVESPFITKEDTFFDSNELIDCITPAKEPGHSNDPEDIYFETIARAIVEKLKEFKILGQVINVLKGPVVDTFELELGAGVKVSGVTNRTNDLSLALKGAPIRMVYPMKGKSTIGIEVPRNPRDFIFLDEVLSSDSYMTSNYRLPIAMGKDAYGDAAVIDLASTPHLLVAGTTGSGKSVFINTLLVSLIIKLSPKKLKLILIDPKTVELALFQKLPHLCMPVVTDSSLASVALLWAIEEMERRYNMLKDFGVKNIDGVNRKLKNVDSDLKYKINKYYPDVDVLTFELPYVVIVVDEFADLVLSKSGKAIEASVSRLAAKARAAGIHIVLATQRPSTDVLTGVVKANFPTRVAFRVTTNTDSRVVLDTPGAERLLGRGDMLFKQGIETIRMHSAFVEEEEIEALVEKLSTIPTEYDQGAMEFIESNGSVDNDTEGLTMDPEGGGIKDELYDKAVECVASYRMASASYIQRRLGVGYNRAANLIEEMERHGVVGPAQGSKPRKVLVPPPSDSTP